AQDLIVRHERPIPLERRRIGAVPDGDEPRIVERENDHRQDGDVEKHQPCDQERAREQALRLHLPASRVRFSKRWNSMIGTTSSMSMKMATELATGQSRFSK